MHHQFLYIDVFKMQTCTQYTCPYYVWSTSKCIKIISNATRNIWHGKWYVIYTFNSFLFSFWICLSLWCSVCKVGNIVNTIFFLFNPQYILYDANMWRYCLYFSFSFLSFCCNYGIEIISRIEWFAESFSSAHSIVIFRVQFSISWSPTLYSGVFKSLSWFGIRKDISKFSLFPHFQQSEVRNNYYPIQH